MTAVVPCYVRSRRLRLHAPGYCPTLRAVLVVDRSRAERQGLPFVADPQTAFMLAICELPPGPQRDLAFALGKTDPDYDFAAFMARVEEVQRS